MKYCGPAFCLHANKVPTKSSGSLTDSTPHIKRTLSSGGMISQSSSVHTDFHIVMSDTHSDIEVISRPADQLLLLNLFDS